MDGFDGGADERLRPACESVRRDQGVEVHHLPPHLAPADLVANTGLGSEVARMAGEDHDPLARDAIILQHIRHRSQRAAGQARALVHQRKAGGRVGQERRP